MKDIGSLRKDMYHKDSKVRKEAAIAIGKLKDIRGMPELKKVLRNDTDVEVRRRAAWALGMIRNQEAVTSLINALTKDEDAVVQKKAAESLRKIGKTAVTPLILDLISEDENFQKQAVKSLSMVGEPAVDTLIKLIGPNTRIHPYIVDILGNIGQPSVDPLIVALRSEDKREIAVESLIKIGFPTIPSLLQAIQNEDMAVRSRVAYILEKIHWKPSNSLEWTRFLIAKKVWKEIEEIGESSVSPLLQTLTINDVEVRKKVIQTLGKIKDSRAVFPLIETLKDPNEEVRKLTSEALREIGGSAVEQLLRAIHNENENIRQGAGRALLSMGEVDRIDDSIRDLIKTQLKIKGNIDYKATEGF